MNKKAQSGPIGFVIMLLVMVILWFLWLGEWFNSVGETAISTGGLVGLEAFLYANLNLWFWLSMILGTMGYMYFAGGNQ